MLPGPRKKFGQHFLQNKTIIENIISAISIKKQDHIVEIGPGQGALTYSLLSQCEKLDLIEIDRDLIYELSKKLAHLPQLHIHESDVLLFDFSRLAQQKKIRLVGNLPYNISTPLLFHCISSINTIEDMHFMLQEEVVDRIAATPDSGSYGRLSVMIQYHCSVKKLFHVPPSAFYPPPKVDSAFLHLKPHTILPITANNYTHFVNLVKKAFQHKRKTIRNNLKPDITETHLLAVNIDPNIRPQEIEIEKFVRLSNYISK